MQATRERRPSDAVASTSESDFGTSEGIALALTLETLEYRFADRLIYARAHA